MLYITGDTHGTFSRLSSKNFPEGKDLTSNDYILILGDFGLLWNNPPSKEELWWKSWLDEKPWTTLFIDGNHENFLLLNRLPTTTMFDNKVGVYSDNIFHLKRGMVYNLCNKKVFTFGGATSIDKHLCKPFKSWWPEEEPSYIEVINAAKELDSENNKVDIILTHDLPVSLASKLCGYNIDSTPSNVFLDFVYNTVKFEKWYAGHFHKDVAIDNIVVLYYNITKVEGT